MASIQTHWTDKKLTKSNNTTWWPSLDFSFLNYISSLVNSSLVFLWTQQVISTMSYKLILTEIVFFQGKANYKYNTKQKIRNLGKCLRSSAKQRPPHSVIAADRKPFPFAGQKVFCHFMSWIWFTHQTLWVVYSFASTDVRRKSLNVDNFIEMRCSVLPSLLPFLQRGTVLSRECL